MPRPRRAARDRRPAITEGERRWAYGEPLGEYEVDVELFTFPARLRAVWEELRDDVVAACVEADPGTRPLRWWEYDAPAPRNRIGGIGTPAHEALAYAVDYERGIPMQWVTPWDVTYYNGRAKDVKGNAIGIEYRDGQFSHPAIDPHDPPRFESEAAYLDRLGLLADEERARLDAEGWPEPEAVTPEDDEAIATSNPTRSD